jgi:hypothetical protein
MSHNKITVQNQSANVSGEIDLNVSNIGSFTSTTNKYLGIDASSNLIQLDASGGSGLSWTPVFHYFGKPAYYGGGFSIDTNTNSWSGTLNARIHSGIVYQNTSYIATSAPGSNSRWATHYLVQPGTYVFNACFMSDIQTSSDRCIVSLLNTTDNTTHGNKGYWGAQQYSNNMYAYVTISSAKTFTWGIESITGSPNWVTHVAILATHINIWRL